MTFSGVRGAAGGVVVRMPLGGWWLGDAGLECDGVGETEAETRGEGEVLAARDDDEEFMSIGITMSAPTTKNTAAMATLDNCIGSSGGWGTYLI